MFCAFADCACPGHRRRTRRSPQLARHRRFGIQPSEFMKIGMIMFLAKMLSDHRYKITELRTGLLPPLGLMGLAFGLIMLQPDLGTGAVLVGASLLIIYTAGARLFHLACLAMVGAAGLAGLIIAAPIGLSASQPSWIPGRTLLARATRSSSRCMRSAPAASSGWASG